jgi:hypothetical protein
MFIINTNIHSKGNKNMPDEHKVGMPLFNLDSWQKSRGNNAQYVHTMTGTLSEGPPSLIVFAADFITRVVFPATKEAKQLQNAKKKEQIRS